MRCLGACSNRINPLSCIRTPVEPVIDQEAAPNAPSSRPGSRDRNVQEPHFSVTDNEDIRNRTTVQNIDEKNNMASTNNSINNENSTDQQTAPDDGNAVVQNRRRFKLLRKLLCMKVPEREYDLTIDYVKGRDEDITMKEKLERAEFLVQCEINHWTAEEEMSEREAITNEENVKILQSNYKYLVQRKALIQQEVIKYQSYVETLRSELPDIFINDGHYLQTPLQRIEKARTRYQERFKSQMLPELDIANIQHDEPLSDKVNTNVRPNITPEPTSSGKEDPSKSVPKFTVEGEEPRLDEEEFDHNECVQAVWIQEPDTKMLTFKGHKIIDPLRREEYDGDDESDGWTIPHSWLKEEEAGPSNVQRYRVKNESPNTDREKVRVLRSTSISLSSPTPPPGKGDKIINDDQRVEETKEKVKEEPKESRPESCDSATTEELNEELEKTLVGFIANLLENQEEDLAEDYYSEAENSEDEKEEGPVYIGQIEDGVNTPDRPIKHENLDPKLQECLSSPSKQAEEFQIEVYNTTSKDSIDSISSSIIDACVNAVNEANRRTITPRTVVAIKDMLENSESVILRTQSQQYIKRVALFDVTRTRSTRSCDALTLIDFVTKMFGREEQYSSDFEMESDQEDGSPTPTNSSSTLKDEEIYSNKDTTTNKNGSSTFKIEDISSNKDIQKDQDIKSSQTKVTASSSEDTITLVDINSLLGRKVGCTSDESESGSRSGSSSSGGASLSSDDRLIAEVMASNTGGSIVTVKAPCRSSSDQFESGSRPGSNSSGLSSDDLLIAEVMASNTDGSRVAAPRRSSSDEFESGSRPGSSSSGGASLSSLDDRLIAEVIASNTDDSSIAVESPSQRVITPSTLESIRQSFQDRVRVIRQTRSVQTIARAASNIKRTLSTTSRDFFRKFRRHNAVGIMPATDEVNSS